MAGTILHLVPITMFTWTNLGATTNTGLILSDYIDISQWKEGQLIARAHTGTSIGSGATATLNLKSIDPAFDDPSNTFDAGQVGQVTFDNTAAVGTMKMAAMSANAGLAARLQLILQQASGAPVSATLVMSVDLVLKTDD